MTLPQPASKACHNCRRRRWKCDRSLPQCVKCVNTGQECLGYLRLFRWEPGLASRGKMVGRTFGEETQNNADLRCSKRQSQFVSIHSNHESRLEAQGSLLLYSPLEPLVQDLDPASRTYISYFASDVCKDLVLYDVPGHNPFRELISRTHQHSILLHVISAVSALHMSNACWGPLVLCNANLSPYRNALAAKQRALCMMRSAIQRIESANIDVILAVVLLFIQFELIDSGRDNWTSHIKGARAIIERLCGSDALTKPVMSPLRSFLVSNCLVFDVVGSTLTSSEILMPSDRVSSNTLSLLQDAEGNHCSSFPASLLRLVQSGSQLHSSKSPRKQGVHILLDAARSFDPSSWASSVQLRSPIPDLFSRTRIASAHRGAVCIYLSRILVSIDLSSQACDEFESLVAEVIDHLSLIGPGDALFIATTWPTFVVGAETDDQAKQEWVTRRFQQLWEVEPWGLNREALGVLERMWAERERSARFIDSQVSQMDGRRKAGDWISDLKAGGVDWLVI